MRSHIQLDRAKVYAVFCGELFRTLYLCSVAASGLAHAGVNGVTCDGESACREGAKAARSSCDDDDVLHLDSPVLRVMGMEGMTGDDVCCLCEATVCAKHLRVDPSAVGSGKKRDDVGDIVGLTEPLKRRHAGDLFDLLFSLAVKEELRPYRSRCNGVDRNLVSAKLVGEDMDKAFDACLGGDVRAVGGKVLCEDTAGEGDDTASLGYVLRRLREDEESSAEVRGNDFVEGLDVPFGDGRKRHDACVVDHDVDLSEGLEGLLEELLDVFGMSNISLDRKGASAGACDLVDYLFCFACIAGIVDDDAKSVGCKAKGDGASDAAGCSGYDSCLSHGSSPFWRLLRT